MFSDTEQVIASANASSIEAVQARISPLREQLANHQLYASIRDAAGLRIFMEAHVFAVWDFMSLLKSMQGALTCVSVPWVPTRSAASRRFINEIVLGEESDAYEGRPISHFELYLEAMEHAGASTSAIRHVIAAAGQTPCGSVDLDIALEAACTPARLFVQATFDVIRHGSVAAQAAAFTFGREDAIPAMFRSLVRDLNRDLEGDLSLFVWYLERHIEVDGDEHGPLSLRMVADLCAENPALWGEAAEAAENAIRARLQLWDGILAQIQTSSR